MRSRKGRIIPLRSGGQIAVMMAGVLMVMLGMMALSTDVAVLYYKWARLQNAADAAVLAGANFLPGDPIQAEAVAVDYAQRNGATSQEINSISFGGADESISIQMSRTSPYLFGKVLGLTSADIGVSSTAAVQAAGSMGPSGNSTPGSTVGEFPIVPVTIDGVHSSFQDGKSITLDGWRVGAEFFGQITLGNGSQSRTAQVANGFSGPLTVGEQVSAMPGDPWDAARFSEMKAGFDQRFQLADQIDPNGTYLNHASNNPRVVVMPLIDWHSSSWKGANSTGTVIGFATVFVEGVGGGGPGTPYPVNHLIYCHYIRSVFRDALPDRNAPSFGALAQPALTD